MVNIDYIMELFDWNNSEEKQLLGIELAKNVKCINAFIQPGKPYGKNVWENCAKVLCERTDDELAPYLSELMEWLQDLNWPGALYVLKRLQQYEKDAMFDLSLNISLKVSRALKDNIWKNNLLMINKKAE